MELKESSGIKFSLSFLIQVLGTVVVAVWGYSQLDQRINIVNNMATTNAVKVKNIEVDIKENQDKPIPSDHVQNTKIFAQERELKELKERITILEGRVFEIKIN